ncbi:hypothetical protein [Sphingomonas sp.]|uniref:hypothetical protein n=1 Tax=Sphingomonas sp. TaxID=28214 RepID=UPI003B3B1DDA
MSGFALAVLVICGFMLACGALTGRIPGRLPPFTVDRNSNPGTFRFCMTGYAIGALAGAVMILPSLI